VKMPYFHVLFGFGFSVLQLGHLAISDHFYGCCFWAYIIYCFYFLSWDSIMDLGE
jgi:hypothetical protein